MMMMMEVSNNSNNNNHHHQKRIRINNIQIGFIVLIVLCTFSNIIPTTKFNNSSFLFRGGDRTISTGGGGEKINNNNNNETGLAMTVDTSSSSSSSSPSSPSMISNQNDVLLPPTTTTSTSSSSFIISSDVQNHGVNNNNNQNITTTTTTTTSIIIPSAKKDHNHLLFIAPRQQTFNNMSLNRSLEILQDLGGGKNVQYNGANLICINKFKINGKDFNINNKNNKTKTNNKAKAIIRKPEIYWYDYRQQQQQQSNNNNNNNLSSSSSSIRSSRRNSRVLIAQSAGFGKYGDLLDATVPITKAYARRWNMTVLIIQGSLVVMDEERKQNCIPGEHRSTHNKMQILQYALHHRDQFDYVLLLDADALIYKFSIDISTLFYNTTTTTYNSTINTTTTTPDKFLLAHRIGGRNDGTWKVNAGVTLWYLQHPNLPILINAWQRSALGYFNTRNNDSGDQQFLYHALKNNPNNLTLSANVYGLDKEFQYNKGSVIKHIKRPKLSYQPGKTKVDERRSTIDKFINEICSKKFPKDCERLDYFNYSQV